jgi:hypothetical protein
MDLGGPYFPGHLKGDRVWVCVRRSSIQVTPRDGAARIVRVASRSATSILEFDNGWEAEVPRDLLSAHPGQREWDLDVPKASVHVLSK